jgi:hypothetical protein
MSLPRHPGYPVTPVDPRGRDPYKGGGGEPSPPLQFLIQGRMSGRTATSVRS